MENENLDNRNNTEAEFDLKGLLLDYLAHYKWFALSVAICLVAAFIYLKSVVPTYSIQASIYLNDVASANENAFNLGGANNPIMAFKDYIDETELEVMKSRNNLVKIVDTLGLCYTYSYKGTLRDTPLYRNTPVTASFDSIALRNLKKPVFVEISPRDSLHFDIDVETEFNEESEEKEFRDAELPLTIELSHGTLTLTRNALIPEFERTEKIVIVSPKDMALDLSKRLSMEFPKNSEKIINVTLLSEVPERGDDVIHALLDFYNQDIIEDKNRSAVQTEAFILERLGLMNDELKDVESRMRDYRQQHGITDLQAQSQINLTQQSQYESKMAEIDAELALYDEIENIIKSSSTHQTLPTVVNLPALTTVIENYNRKVNQFQRTFEGSTSDNPLVRNMLDELNNDRMRIMQSIAGGRRNLAEMKKNLRRLDNQAGAELASQPNIDKGFQEIFREQQVKDNIYTFLLQRREEIALQKTLATSTARLIDDPLLDIIVSPRKALTMAVALLIGLLIPGLIIYLRRTLFPSFGNAEDVKKATKVPVLGEICRDEDSKEKRLIVVGENNSTPVAELFRLLRNNISFTGREGESRVILVTSSMSGEGKTFISANLAMTYALMNKRVLVIGMDLRRPLLAGVFGLTNKTGVSAYLAGKESNINDIIVQSKDNPNLYILTAGPVPPNPNELLMNDRMKQLIDTVRNEYDYVIIDSAPIGLVSDTFLISRLTDIQLFVIRADKSTRNSLSILNDAAASHKLPSPYVVVNDVNIHTGVYSYQRYGYYSSKKKKTYGYGY